MIVKRNIAPPYLQFFISDSAERDNPVPDVENIRILYNGRCLSVPCAYWEEAETELLVGAPHELGDLGAPLFDDTIPTHSGIVSFTDVEMTELLAYPAAGATTRIWTDGLRFPEHVVVAIG